ncbi:MAG TPA: hypothetical protein VMV84_00995 [Dehalococcoidales bacterium]|nr:hypothetical protein [Dehalococcoidales bacterium]
MTERRFDDGYWDDPFVQSLSKDGKLLYAYLWTNKHCNQAGLFQITPSTIAFETKLIEADIPELFQELNLKVIWYPAENLVWVKNFIKRQSISSKFLVAVARCLNSINSNGAINALINYNRERYALLIPYEDPIDRVSIPSISTSKSISKSNEGVRVVKGKGEIPPSESESEESLSVGDREVISIWRSVKRFSMPIEEAADLVARVRTEFPDIDILDESKAWAARKLSESLTPRSRPSSQIWNWMRKAREFAQERRKGEQQSRKPKQERKRPITYIDGHAPAED